jgi:hypothetical protein
VPRDLTPEEDRWLRRLKRTLDAMPETLKGFHYPGAIAFADRDDPDLIGNFDAGAADRQRGVIETVSSRALDRIDAGDW